MCDYFACMYIFCTPFMPGVHERIQKALDPLQLYDYEPSCGYWQSNPGL